MVEKIEAFPMWKMFSETMNALLKPEVNESSIQRFSNVIIQKSKEYSNIFTCERNLSIDIEEYQANITKYKVFNKWLLGQFFYFSTIEKLMKINSVIIEAQQSILNQLSKTHLEVYSELSEEYKNVFNFLTNFVSNESSKPTILKCFQNLNFEDIKDKLFLESNDIEINSNNYMYITLNVLPILEFILREDFRFQNFNSKTIESLNNLLIFLTNGDLIIKFEVILIFSNLSNFDTFGDHFLINEKIILFFSYLNQLVFNIYNKNYTLSNDNYKKFENILIQIFQSIENAEYLKDITNFIFNKTEIYDKLSENFQIIIIQKAQVLNIPTKYSNNSLSLLNNKIYIYTIYDVAQKECKIIKENQKNLFELSNGIWTKFIQNFNLLLEQQQDQPCEKFKELIKFLNDLMILLIKLKINYIRIRFFPESILINIINMFENHFNCCTLSTKDILMFFTNLPLMMEIKFKTLIEILGHPTIKILYGNHLIVKDVVPIFNYDKLIDLKEIYFVESFMKLIDHLSNGLINNFSMIDYNLIEDITLKIFNKIHEGPNYYLLVPIIRSLPNILLICPRKDLILRNILVPIISIESVVLKRDLIKIFASLICLSSSPVENRLNYSENHLKNEIICLKCHPNESNNETITITDLDPTLINSVILKELLNNITGDDTELIILSLNVFSSFSNHFLNFYSLDVTKIWIQLCHNENLEIRRNFSKIIGLLLTNLQNNNVLLNEIKSEIFNIIFSTLLEASKKSLILSDYNLQETLLDIIDEINNFELKRIAIILIYFIMTPTSKHALIAVNKFSKLAEAHNFTSLMVFKHFKKEICQIIVHLSCINKVLFNYNLHTSLKKISLTFEYYGCKSFIQRECHHLLPFFVTKTIQMEGIDSLIEEIAVMCDTEVSDLLSMKYGHIFLHCFLNESRENFSKCMKYIESSTGLKGPILRKKNVRIILNELLLNFHEKHEQALLTLSLLKKEDQESKALNIQDYLQPQFLGLLQYFDFKLINSNYNEKILLSLADLFKFMGPKHIGSLRFKIIAMLRTAKYNSPQLNCDIWDAFIKSCDCDILGPQLATIIVSILPILNSSSGKVMEIFHYLLIENQTKFHDYLKDLFFLIDEEQLNETIKAVIKNHIIKIYENCSLKEKLEKFLKYLLHETLEIRVKSFYFVKKILEENREELDQMILGFNGIDPVIVELIDVLMINCREKDDTLKLACAELFGELGAIEPSHLPRRLAHNNQSFTFYITDDCFIINALNELIRALQSETNTYHVDRFAIAIQEILKNYEISPERNSKKAYLWKKFSEFQQQLMLPLLSSKYIIKQPVTTNFPNPIYGSPMGSSFQSWLHNWTCNLILTLPQENKNILSVCLPSMKQDNRILMHFLPYILLHSLIKDNANADNSFKEIKAIISSFSDNTKIIDKNILNARPFPITNICSQIEKITSEDVQQIQCTKVVFLLLDFLDHWLREWQGHNGVVGLKDPQYQSVYNFLRRFCKLELAKCNYNCAEYPRALICLEDFINENHDKINENLAFLAEIYAQLNESDGVMGCFAIKIDEPSIEQRILALEVSGKLSDAAACYERMEQPLKLHHLQGLIQCYLDLDNVNTALNFAQGAYDWYSEYSHCLLEMQAEPLWRLGRYEDLNNILETIDREGGNRNIWSVELGRALISFQQNNWKEFFSIINNLKRQQIEFLGAASSEGSYQNGYSFISRLHILNEFELIQKTVRTLLDNTNGNSIESSMNNLKNVLNLRIKVVQESVRIIEPVFCIRRIVLEQAKDVIEKHNNFITISNYFNELLGESWLMSSKIARHAGYHQQAYTYTVKAEQFIPKELFIEKAKLYWLREEHELALTTLKRGLEKILPQKEQLTQLTLEDKKLYAHAKLLIATFNDSMSNVDMETNIVNYKESTKVYREWEKSLVFVGQYYDKIFQSYLENERDSKGGDIQICMINYFGKSLLYGTEYIYQSMPRLLSIWFDYGTRLLDVKQEKIQEERKLTLIKMTKLIDDYLQRLPSFIFFTAFSQLVSRISHPQKEVYIELKSIIIKLLIKFPQQSLWMLISVIKSSYALRSKRCAEILSDQQLNTNELKQLIKDFTLLAEKLNELCNKEISGDVSKTTVNALMRSLPRLLSNEEFSQIMVPTHKLRKLILPNPDFNKNNSQYNPFPNQYVYISGIEEEIVILRSLQRPRKISFKGSDGKSYIQMLKPKDDLRKDFRLMEFNDIVNQLLSRDSEARQRRLNIRLYSVVPLNEECGLIEWVPNLLGLRVILMDLYKQQGLGMKNKEIKDISCSARDSLIKKRQVFIKQLLPRHPPILGDWFRKTFADPENWLIARTAYIRTTAVISMVGYILGLGDRHGENILLDSICGDTVHVDFNCLFNKGETFEYPERVPFRLTQNMIHAMGPLGIEGIFRKSCACTLKVLRTNTNILMSIVTPFVYDPLLSWPRNVPVSSASNSERINEQAVEHVKNIELRLKGIVKTRSRSLSIPLSVDGQVNSLINEAINIDNLCQMYLGWGPYL